MILSFLFRKDKGVASKTDFHLSPINEKMRTKVQQDINRQALIKLLDLEVSVISRRSDDFYNSNNITLGSS